MTDKIEQGRALLERAIKEQWEIFSPEEVTLVYDFLSKIRAESKARGDYETEDVALVWKLTRTARLQIADRAVELKKQKESEVSERKGKLQDLEHELRALKRYCEGEDQD